MAQGKHDENNGDTQGMPAVIAREDTAILRPPPAQPTQPMPEVRTGQYRGIAVEPGVTLPDFRVYRTLEAINYLISVGRPGETIESTGERTAIMLLTDPAGRGTPLRCERCRHIYLVMIDQEPDMSLVGVKSGLCASCALGRWNYGKVKGRAIRKRRYML